jgi:hypothetical protein
MKFGIGIRKKLSGAGLYLYVLQFSALATCAYMLVASGYLGLLAKKNVLSVLFDLGASALPRWETLLLSYVYRFSLSEVVLYFAVLGTAIVYGIAMNKVFNAKHDTARKARIAVIALIGADLIFRLLPFHFNIAFGLPAAIFGFVVRAGCLVLLVLDLKADKKTELQNTAE